MVNFSEVITDYSEIESGLSYAPAVFDLNCVAAAVFLLSFWDGQLTAAVCAHYRDAVLTLLNLDKKKTHFCRLCRPVDMKFSWWDFHRMMSKHLNSISEKANLQV